MRVSLAISALAALFAGVTTASAQSTWPPPERLPNGPSAGIVLGGGPGAAPAGVGACGASGASGASSSDEIADDRIIATVGGKAIRYGEIRKRIGAKISQKKSKYLRERREEENNTLDK